MIRRSIPRALFFCLLAGISVGSYCDAKPGDIYTGEFVSQDTNGLVINIAPCDPKEVHVTIKKYRKKELGEETCPGAHGRKYQKVEVEELAPADTSRGTPKAGPK